MKLSPYFLFLIVVLVSCQPKDQIEIIRTNAKGEVPVLGNLTFTFNRNMVADSMTNQWVEESYFEFNPPIPGKFRWQQPNELVFSPEKDLKPATQYKASFQWKGKGKPADNTSLEFHTPWLKVEQFTALWTGIGDQAALIAPELVLHFNYEMTGAELLKHLEVHHEGKVIPFNLDKNAVSKEHSIRISGLRIEDKDYGFEVVLKKGMLPPGGSTETTKDIKLRTELTSPYKLNIYDCQASHDGITATIQLYTSQQIAENQDFKKFIRFDPGIPFEVKLTNEGMEIVCDKVDVSRTYNLHISAGLMGIAGGKLKQNYVNTLSFGALEPSISFVDQNGMYLSKSGKKNLEVRIVNVKEVTVSIHKIYENNILAMRKHGFWQDEYDPEYVSEYATDDYESSFGDLVYKKKVTTSNLPKYRNSRLLHFDFPDNLPDFKGIYVVRISSEEQWYTTDTKVVSLSDIGLMARQGKSGMHVFAAGLGDANPKSGVNITLYGLNNQKIGQATTNENGYALLPLSKRNIRGFAPAMIVAKQGSDFNYMPLSQTRIETSRFDVGGAMPNKSGLLAYVYGARDLYRPGETVNFSAIVRTQTWKIPEQSQMKIQVLLPNGQEFKSIRKVLNKEGSLESSFALPAGTVSGAYTIEVYGPTDILIGSEKILVEEFVPDRIRVQTTMDQKKLVPGQKGNIHLRAENYFGPPAANRNYEVEIQLKETVFQAKKYPNYHFGLQYADNYYESNVMEGETDEQGKAEISFEVPAHYKDRGLLQADAFTTVFDETGRPVSRSLSIPVFTQNTFYGIRQMDYSWFQTQQPIQFFLLALNQDGIPYSSAKAHVVVIKHDYKTVISRSGSYFRYESQRQDKTISDKTLMLKGSQSYYSFTPNSPGEYEIRIARPGSNNFVSTSFYCYGWVGNYNVNHQVNKEGHVDISTDKESYEIGEKAKVLFKTPFNGKLLVTIEQQEVISYKYLDVRNRSANFELALESEHLPNVYITATLIRPHEESTMPLTVAHGYKSLGVTDIERKLNVQILVPEKSRSNLKQKVRVKTRPGSMVTLAAVDEGILQMTSFQSPDPHGYYYAKRALNVTGFDLYPWLLPEVGNSSKSTGGDGYNLSKRVNPLPNKRVKLLSYWSGITDTKSGEAEFEVTIPQFSGEVRFMAVAYQNQSFGHAEASMKVADPLVVSSGLPRFLSPGDTVDGVFTMTNTTTSEQTVQFDVKTAGSISIKGFQKQQFRLKPGAEIWKVVRLVAGNSPGLCRVEVQAEMNGEKFGERTDLTIRPASSLVKTHISGKVENGETRAIQWKGRYLKGSSSRSIYVSRSPVLQYGKNLQYLIEYPYGCTEQIVSAAFPQIYYNDLSDMMLKDRDGKALSAYHINEAIRMLKTRQLYNGALTLWDGYGEEHWYASAYAAHFLYEARKAGFEVPTHFTDPLLEYLRNKLNQKERTDYFFNRNQNRSIAPKSAPYSLFVLALYGKPLVPVMNYYRQHSELLSLDGKYLLAGAYALSGDKEQFRQMLPKSYQGESVDYEGSGSFSSPLRDEALALYTLLAVDPGNAQIPNMARHISPMLADGRLNTQEHLFGLLALGQMARSSSSANGKAEILADGKVIATVSEKGMKIPHALIRGKQVEIRVSGGPMYYYVQEEGIGLGNEPEVDEGISVRRQYFNRYGNEIYPSEVKSHELLIVQITLDNHWQRNIKDIVISDLLPAGFEIENHRVKQIPGMSWIKNESTATHVDMRDDRIHFFVDLGSERQTYYYAVRAVTPGYFRQGPVTADAMYMGDIYSRNGYGMVRVR